jgi:hypothetical protein
MRAQVGAGLKGDAGGAPYGVLLISSWRLSITESPTFSTVWGGRGSSGIGEFSWGASGDWRVSRTTLPEASRRMKSLELDMSKTAGQRWVWRGTIWPGRMRVWMRRTRSFSKRRVWWSGAAIRASRESGHDQAKAAGFARFEFIGKDNGKSNCNCRGKVKGGGQDARHHTGCAFYKTIS